MSCYISTVLKKMGKIKNFEDLATNPGRKAALQIIEAGLDAVDTRKIIKEKIFLEDGKLCIKDYWCSIEDTRRIVVVGVGKCAMEAASALEEVLGDYLYGGIVLDVYKSDKCILRKIECLIGTHPMPSE